MDYLLSKLLPMITTSGALLMLMLLAGVGLLWLKSWKRGRAILTAVVLALAAMLVLPVQPLLTGMLENRFAAEPPLPEHIDGIIILGGMVRPAVSKGRGRPSFNDAAERLIEGVRLARLHPEAKVLFTGGSADPLLDAIKEADYARPTLLALGIEPERLLIEDQSRNTYENAVFSRAVVPDGGQGNWILVTSAIHLPRSVGVFRQAGWKVIPWPINYLTGGDTQWANEDVLIQRLYYFSRTLHELVGLAYYRLRGWSRDLFPGPV